MTIDVEQRLREVGSRVEVANHEPAPSPARGVRQGFPWRTLTVAALVLAALGAAALVALPGDGSNNDTVVAGPESGAGPDVAVESGGLVFRAEVEGGHAGHLCLRPALPVEATPTTAARPVCVEPREPESLAVGWVDLEQPPATVVYAIGGSGVGSMQAAIDQVAVPQAANAGHGDVAVFLMVVEVADATGHVDGLDRHRARLVSAPFGTAWSRHSLPTHCGVKSTTFEGQLWIASPPMENPGSRPPGWGGLTTEGRFAVLDEDTAEFRADSGGVARFTRAPEGAKNPNEGCQ